MHAEAKKQRPDEVTPVDAANIQAQTYTFRELATATKNFRQECLLAESGFGRVYKGTIPTTGKVMRFPFLRKETNSIISFFLILSPFIRRWLL